MSNQPNTNKGELLKSINVAVVALAVIAVVLAILWVIIYTTPTRLGANCANLQKQYQQLQSQYSKLNGTYWNILSYLGNISGSSILQPGYFTATWVVVPRGFTGVIHITVTASSPIEVYVLNLYNYGLWIEDSSYTYYLYDQGTYINDTVTVDPNLYIIVFYDPSSTTTVTYSVTISTTYIPTPS